MDQCTQLLPDIASRLSSVNHMPVLHQLSFYPVGNASQCQGAGTLLEFGLYPNSVQN
jgi:hypothetical protein